MCCLALFNFSFFLQRLCLTLDPEFILDSSVDRCDFSLFSHVALLEFILFLIQWHVVTSTCEYRAVWILPSHNLPTAGVPNYWRANLPPSSHQHAGVKINCVGYYTGVGTLARQGMGTEPNDGQNHVGAPTFGWASFGVKPNIPIMHENE